MNRVLFWGGAALVVVLQSLGMLSSDDATVNVSDDNVLEVREGDPRMEAAREAALAHLPRFLEQAKNPPASWQNVTLKIAMQGTAGVDNIWVANFRETGAQQYEAYLANEPVDLPGMHACDKVTFSHDQINDWAFIEDGKGYGLFSAHAMLDMVSAEEAEAMRQFLAENPVPAGW